MNTPEGFKSYHKIMLRNGELVEPASCWLVNVDVFSERDLVEAVKVNRLDDVAKWYDAQDLALVMRRGMDTEPLQKLWTVDVLKRSKVGEIVLAVIAAPSAERALEIFCDSHGRALREGDCRIQQVALPKSFEGVVFSMEKTT